MSLRLTSATAARVLRQIRHDPRTVALLIFVPIVVLGLMAWMFDGTPFLNQTGPVLLGLFPLIIMFIVTSVTTLRERQSGTMERLMSTPIGKADVVFGYAIAFGVLAVFQGLITTAVAVWGYGMDVAGDLWVVILVAVLDAILGAALGLAGSALASTEFQAVQLMPAFLFPQLVLGGLLMPRAAMPQFLEWISRAMPLTYALDALQNLALGAHLADVQGAVCAILAFITGALLLGSLTLRRRTP